MQYDRKAAAISSATLEPERPRLLDEVRRRLRLKHYSLRTEQAYLYWIRRYIRADVLRHPREIGGAEIEQFLRAAFPLSTAPCGRRGSSAL